MGTKSSSNKNLEGMTLIDKSAHVFTGTKKKSKRHFIINDYGVLVEIKKGGVVVPWNKVIAKKKELNRPPTAPTQPGRTLRSNEQVQNAYNGHDKDHEWKWE